MDDLDRASLLEEVTRGIAIRNVVSKVKPIPLNDSGVCWTCGCDVRDTRRWCDAECRDLLDE